MTFLMFQIFMSLLVAAAIGAGAVWLLRRSSERRRAGFVQREWRERLRQVELERDRTKKQLTSKLEGQREQPAGSSEALNDYQKLVAGLEDRVAERENAISDLRTEIQSLRQGLRESEQTAADLRAEHERDLLAIQAEHESYLRAHEDESGARDVQIRQLEADAAEHKRKLAGLRQRLTAATDTAGNEAARAELLTERDSQIRQLQAEISARDASISKLQQQIDSAQREAVARSDGQTREQERRIENLESVIAARDDTIAELRRELSAIQRDDVAELAGGPPSAGRGSHDEMLRAAIAESEQLQQQYRSVSEQLAQRESELEAMRQELEAAGAGVGENEHAGASPGRRRSVRKKRRPAARSRSAGERIAVLLTRPDDGHRDNLQEIRGIGPALEKTLHAIGIHHFHQIAQFDAADVGRVAREIGRFGNRIVRDDWVGQARVLHRKYHG